MASSGMAPISDIVKIGQLVQTLSGVHIQTHRAWSSESLFFLKGKWANAEFWKDLDVYC
jgi:hypothetical protein